MFLLGLTGSIGMGKSTTAQMFADEGCDVWDADAAVHRLYAKNGAAVAPFLETFPNAVVEGQVDRQILKEIIGADPTALKKIEAIVHPLVAEDRADFIQSSQAEIIVLDIPLLFETGGNKRVDAVVCVHVDPETQEKRVLARGTMTREQFLAIRQKQMASEEKCKLSDYVIETYTVDEARHQVKEILREIRKKISHA